MKGRGVLVWTAAALTTIALGAAVWGADQPKGGKAPSSASASAASAPAVANPHQRHNLPDKPSKPRFELRDLDWPAKAGEASICLWKDDAIAAASTGVDDNCSDNLPWWIDMSRKYGLRPTWWLITGNVNSSKANGGTWDAWKKILASGLDVQSHTVNHLHTESPTWKDMETEYADSQKAVNENVPGARCLTLAYPGGANQALNDPALAAKYYIAGRTGIATINPANAIEYLQVHATSAFNVTEAKFPGGNLVTVFDKSPKNPYWRGWWVGFFHWVKTDDAAQTASCEKRFAYIQGKVQSGELWLGLFREVAQYGQERDTARLEVKSVTADKIVLALTDEMDDMLFDFPLTVKVRLDAAWKSAKATQGAKETLCKVMERDGGKFALVQVVPDRGDVVLQPATPAPASATSQPATQ